MKNLFLYFSFFWALSPYFSPLFCEDSQATSVILGQPQVIEADKFLSFSAKLKAPEQIELLAQIEGILEKQFFQEGSWVEAGATIFLISSPQTQYSLEVAQAQYEQAKLKFETHKELHSKQASSLALLKEAQAKLSIAHAELKKQELLQSYTEIKAPFGGFLTTFTHPINAKVKAGATLSRLINTKKIEAEFFFSESFLTQVQLNQAANFIPLAYPESKFEGMVCFISPHVDKHGAQIMGKAFFENPQDKLLPNMHGELQLLLEKSKKGLFIPKRALIQSEEGPFFYYYQEGKAHKFPVQLGRELGNFIEILNLEDPQISIITQGQFKIWEEGQLVKPYTERENEAP